MYGHFVWCRCTRWTILRAQRLYQWIRSVVQSTAQDRHNWNLLRLVRRIATGNSSSQTAGQSGITPQHFQIDLDAAKDSVEDGCICRRIKINANALFPHVCCLTAQITKINLRMKSYHSDKRKIIRSYWHAKWRIFPLFMRWFFISHWLMENMKVFGLADLWKSL